MEKQFADDPKRTYEGDAITSSDDVIDIILEDHTPIKKYLDILKDESLERAEKELAFEEMVPLLLQHAKAEEESLYSKMKNYDTLRMRSFAGETEHLLAEELIQKINSTPDDDDWKAKILVLAETVSRHIAEEEGEVLPEISRQLDNATRRNIADEYMALKLDYSLLLMEPHSGPEWEAVIE